MSAVSSKPRPLGAQASISMLLHRSRAWFSRLSIAHKLNAILLTNALVVFCLVAITLLAQQATDGVRGYVGGEGLWSKGQKSAVYHLSRFVSTGETAEFERFEYQVGITRHIERGRLEMETPGFSYTTVEQAFMQAGIPAEDIPNMVWLFQHFRGLPFLHEAVSIWREGDRWIARLIRLSTSLQQERALGPMSPARQQDYLEQIEFINAQLTPLERAFSKVLSDGARMTHDGLLGLIISAALILLCLNGWISRRLTRDLRAGVAALHRGAVRVAEGDLNHQVKIHSQDELGELAHGFNAMIRLRRAAESALDQRARELQQSNANLERSNVELRRLYQAEAASEAKSRFLATMSHEIRTPLHGILGLLEVFDADRLSAEQREKLELMRHSGQALKHLINDILDLAKIEAGRMELEPKAMRLDELGTSIRAALLQTAREKQVELRLSMSDTLPDYVLGDQGRLTQILLNLASNALKFTPSGGQVTIEISASKLESDDIRLHFIVHDTGIGIDQEAQARIFDSFVQAETSTSRQFGGTGLGLAICKGLVEQMGGEIGCASQPGRGSRFWFEIPSAPAPRPGATTQNRGSRAHSETGDLFPAGAAIRILIAEDNPVNQAVIRHQLARYNCRLHIVDDGEQALQVMQKERFDLLITDLQMPRLDGCKLTQAIRREEARNPGATPMTIIGLTANAQKQTLAHCRKLGMDDTLVKPLSLARLDQCLRHWARVNHAR